MKGVYAKMAKSLFETANSIEQQSIQLGYAKAVLVEIMRYFEKTIEPDTAEAYAFIKEMDQITNLLHLLFELLYNALPDIIKGVDELIEHYKAEKRGRETEEHYDDGNDRFQKLLKRVIEFLKNDITSNVKR